MLNNDQLRHLTATLCTFTSVYRLYLYYNREMRFIRFYVLSTVAMAVSLLAKESALACFALVNAVIAAHSLIRRDRRGERIAFFLRHLAPFLLIVVSWFVYRFAVIDPLLPTFGEKNNYDVHFGMNIPWNLAMLGFAFSEPVSSVNVHHACTTGDSFLSLLYALSALLVFALCVFGLQRLAIQQRRIVYFLAAFTVITY